MTRKKAQFGLDSLISYLVFGVFLLFTMVALTLSGCGSSKKAVERGIDVDKGGLANLRASEQLSAYLATKMPDGKTLRDGINSIDDGKMDWTHFDKAKALEFLNEHPEVYADQTYAEFISALYVYRDDGRVGDVFDAVTKAVFQRRLYSKGSREGNPALKGFYVSPMVSVSYGMKSGFHFDNGQLTSAYRNPIVAKGSAFRTLPTLDNYGVTVNLLIYGEDASEPLP